MPYFDGGDADTRRLAAFVRSFSKILRSKSSPASSPWLYSLPRSILPSLHSLGHLLRVSLLLVMVYLGIWLAWFDLTTYLASR